MSTKAESIPLPYWNEISVPYLKGSNIVLTTIHGVIPSSQSKKMIQIFQFQFKDENPQTRNKVVSHQKERFQYRIYIVFLVIYPIHVQGELPCSNSNSRQSKESCQTKRQKTEISHSKKRSYSLDELTYSHKQVLKKRPAPESKFPWWVEGDPSMEQ
jgi:hypothetical protein